ncbi:hypothetical protein B0H12DRAFT_1155634, partial [Mycena haematopus]
MDHLPIPPGTTHLRVPYKCTELFDGGDFFGYPDRKNWSKEKRLGYKNFGHEKRRTSRHSSRRIEIETSEFLTTDSQSGAQFVTTSVLPAKIRAWKTEWVRRRKKRDSASVKATHMILEKVKTYLDRYCGVEDRESEGSVRAPTTMLLAWPVADEITISMIALGHILGSALREISGNGNVGLSSSWPASPRLKTMMVENCWCPMDVRRFTSDVGIDGHYYLALKKYPSEEYRHGGCTESACRALIVDEGTYVVQHVDPGCSCEEEMATEAVVEVVKQGGVPVVAWRKNVQDGGSRFIVENAISQNVAYVAISHVWADGLGNPRRNALPACQLERLQARVNAVFPETDNSPVRFWMDTLCIPVAEEYDELRKASIKMMRQIYRRAGAVLVLDKGLQQLSTFDAMAEKALGLYLSNWVHRLWTFQEGMLAKELHFLLKDGVVKEMVPDEDCGHSAEERAYYAPFPRSTINIVFAHFTFIKDLIEAEDHDNRTLLHELSHGLQQRTTTRMSDEAICIAAILDLDMGDIVDVKTKDVLDEVAAEKRMQILFKKVGVFRPGIIFHAQKRMRTEGEGLPVTYSGFVLESVEARSATEIIFPEDAEEVADCDTTL